MNEFLASFAPLHPGLWIAAVQSHWFPLLVRGENKAFLNPLFQKMGKKIISQEKKNKSVFVEYKSFTMFW